MLQPAEAPARPARPSSVIVAYWLQLATVVVLLLLIGVVVWHAVYWDGAIDRAAQAVPDADPTEVSDERTVNVAMSAVLSAFVLLPAIGLAITAQFVRLGHNVARIVTFVLAGVLALCGVGPACVGGLLAPVAFLAGAPVPEDAPPDVESGAGWGASRFSQELYGNVSSTEDLIFGSGLLGLATVFVLMVVVVVLLAVPPASRYFVARHASAPSPAHFGYPAGYPMPAVPSGLMICPDPALHLPRRATTEPPPGPEPGRQPPGGG